MIPRQLLATGQAITDRLQAALQPFALLALRLPVAWVFWASARTKVEGWNIFAPSPSAFFLFEHEYGLPFPVLSAHLATLAEHILPVLLVLGLATRLGALGLLTMTMVIQLFVYPDAWVSHHMFWAAILFAVLALGPGRFSLDQMILRRLQG